MALAFGALRMGALADSYLNTRTIALAVLEKVALDISVVLGTTSMPVHQVLRLGRGAIIELAATEDDEVKILANNMPIASGLVVVNGNRIAVEVKEMLPRASDLR
jgi:flagellar motor switch protein FliN